MSSPTPYSQTSFMSPLPSATPEVELLDVPRLLDDTPTRHQESDAIALRLRQHWVDERSSTKSMSPEYVATLPKSMIDKLRVTPEEIEEILFHYAATSSIPRTVEETGLPRAKVHAVVYSPENQSQLEALRSAMRITVIRKIEETQLILLDALQSPSKLNDASLTQISSILQDVSEVSSNLRSASRDSGGLATMDPSNVFSADELEYMAFLRRRLTSPSAIPEIPYEPFSASRESGGYGSTMNGHEIVDPNFAISDSIEISPSEDEANANSVPR